MPLDLPPDTHRLVDDHHPTPFSAEQIRGACGPGRRHAFRVTSSSDSPHQLVWWFEDVTPEGCVIARLRTGLDGVASGEAYRTSARWIDLQRHASYPVDTTRIEFDEVDVVAGTFECWRYVTSETAEGSETRSWFAAALPGPPILQITTDTGHEVFRSELVEFDDPRNPE